MVRRWTAGRGAAGGVRAALTCLLGTFACSLACSARPPEQPADGRGPAPPSSVPSSRATTAPDAARCAEADILLERAAKSRSSICAARFADEAARRCAAQGGRAEPLLEAALAGIPAGTLVVSRDGAFALRRLEDGGLVYALEGDEPAPTVVIEGPLGVPTFDGRRLLLQRSEAIDWVDLATRESGSIPDASAFAIDGGARLVAGKRSILRFDDRWTLLEDMALGFDLEPRADALSLLPGGQVRVSDVVVRLDRDQVVFRGALRAVDPKGAKALYCTDERTLVAIELETGRELVRLTGRDAACSYSQPVLADSARTIVWLTEGARVGATLHAVDVATGRETTLEDEGAAFGGLFAAASLDPKDDRKICLTLAGKSWIRSSCRWRVANGKIGRVGGASKTTQAPLDPTPLEDPSGSGAALYPTEAPGLALTASGELFDLRRKKPLVLGLSVAAYRAAARAGSPCITD